QRAVKVVTSGEAGSIRAVRLMQHDMAAAMLPAAASATLKERIDQLTLRDIVGDRIAQAVRLIGRPVVSVSATSSRESVSFGMGESTRVINPDGDTAIHIILGCEDRESVIL